MREKKRKRKEEEKPEREREREREKYFFNGRRERNIAPLSGADFEV